MPDHQVVAVLGRGVVPAGTPVLAATDLGVVRGDGIFETMHVRAGDGGPRPWLLDEHLDRLARSADRMELSLPPRDALAGLTTQACAAWPSGTEGALRLVCTRGPESGGPVTVFATLSPLGEPTLRARRDGVAVATATLGVAADARSAAPWLLGGVKSLSYAVNMASQRWAQAQGVDDMLWVSADGYALEAPTSTLVWLVDGRLCTVPAARTGILPGITARWLLERADELGGLVAAEEMVTPAGLAGAEGAWLLSSVRGVAAVRSLDGVRLPESPLDKEILRLLGFPS